MNRAIAYHGLRPVISHRFRLHQVREAYASLATPDHFGKLIIQHD
jgi:NADPH:quinone reductase-like Zn-dependent oxidoreductase